MTSGQCPLLWVPPKGTSDVSYSSSIRSTIAQVFQESPDSYKEEIQSLDRCRQDALRGSAGSDATGRDLLYKYFGQLELLELRFPDVRVPFPWKDAFTGKEISQLSLAYEKASVIFNIAATLSSLAAHQSRSSPEGIKRAFHNFRCAAGMFTYINDNFLHAPSTDMSRDVVKVLVQLMLAQATEVFFEKLTDERKSSALKARVGTQAASLYGAIIEDVRDLVAKGIFEKSWTYLIQGKQKYYISLAQHQRALADQASSKYGESLTRLQVAEAAAKEASRFAASFSAAFHGVLGGNYSNTLPSDAGTCLLEIMKAQVVVCTEAKDQAQRDNDLIYHEAQPSEAALPQIDKSAVAESISIQEVYATPEVQKVVGQDLFVRLVPLSVHESASLYSEEKAKLVRTEGERCDISDSELAAALDTMGLPGNLDKYRDIAGVSGPTQRGFRIDALAEPPAEVRGWAEEIQRSTPPTTEELFRQLGDLRGQALKDLDIMSQDIEDEQRECEKMRVRYGHLWDQAPSSGLTKAWRDEAKAHRSALEAAVDPDQQVADLWRSVQADVMVLIDDTGEALERLFAETISSATTSAQAGNGPNLLDIDLADDDELPELKQHLASIEDALSRLNAIKKERAGVFKDLKTRIQTDDISQLLILNRKSQNVEPALFAAELEKFRPHAARIAATIHHQTTTLQEVTLHYKAMTDGKRAREFQEQWSKSQRKQKDLVLKLRRAKEGHDEVRGALGRGILFYREINEASGRLTQSVQSFVRARNVERVDLASTVNIRQRLEGSTAPGNRVDTASPVSASTPAPAIQSLEQQVRRLDMGSGGQRSLQSPAAVRSPTSHQPPPLPPPLPTGQPRWQGTPVSAHYPPPASPASTTPYPPFSPPIQSQPVPAYPYHHQQPPTYAPMQPSQPTPAPHPPPPHVYSPPPSGQMGRDPYADLGSLGSLGSPSFATPAPSAASAPTPHANPITGYGPATPAQQLQPQYQQQGRQGSLPPPPQPMAFQNYQSPAHHSTPQPPMSRPSGFAGGPPAAMATPPPPGVQPQYQHHPHPGYGQAPPPPPPQATQQWQSQPGGYAPQQMYAGPAYAPRQGSFPPVDQGRPPPPPPPPQQQGYYSGAQPANGYPYAQQGYGQGQYRQAGGGY